MKKLLIPSLLLLSLVACATAPLPDDSYAAAAKDWVTIEQCGVKGFMSPVTAGEGHAFLRRRLNSYQYDTARLKANMDSASRYNETPTAEVCNSFAIKIASVGVAAPAVPSYRPITTNCNTYFGQTHCTTY